MFLCLRHAHLFNLLLASAWEEVQENTDLMRQLSEGAVQVLLFLRPQASRHGTKPCFN